MWFDCGVLIRRTEKAIPKLGHVSSLEYVEFALDGISYSAPTHATMLGDTSCRRRSTDFSNVWSDFKCDPTFYAFYRGRNNRHNFQQNVVPHKTPVYQHFCLSDNLVELDRNNRDYGHYGSDHEIFV